MTSDTNDLLARLARAEHERDVARRIANAMAQIARRINAHPGDLEGNLNEICIAAAALTDSTWGFAWLLDGEVLRSRGTNAGPQAHAALPPEARVQRLDSFWPVAIAAREGRTIVAEDWPSYLREHGETERERSDEFLQHFEAMGTRAVMAVPLGGAPCVGSITVLRADHRPYDDAEIALLEGFAVQAVTAVETARKQQVLTDSLARETAIAEVLQSISRSVDDTAPVFDRILDSCERLFGTDQIALVLVDEHGLVHANAVRGATMARLMSVLPLPVEQTSTGWTFRERRPMHVPDISAFADPPESMRRAAELFGPGSSLFAPMLEGERGIGSIALVRSPPRPFTDAEIDLLTAFTDQAVIAVQNARMFAALQARNREVSEALRREEASSEILRQISNAPEALDATLQTIAEAARRLTGMSSVILLLDDDGQLIVRGLARIDGELSSRVLGQPSLFNRSSEYRNLLQSRELRIFDMQEIAAADWARGRDSEVRAAAFAPIRRGESMLGALAVTTATENPITPQMGTLLQSFADQAAIAIENARLIRELRESNRAISENLDVQRVMGNVLSVVASAPTSVTTTLARISEACTQLCGADRVTIAWQYDGTVFVYSPAAGIHDIQQDNRLLRGSFEEAVLANARMLEYWGTPDDMVHLYPSTSRRAKAMGYASIALLGAPMAGTGSVSGTVSAIRLEAVPFSERQKSVLLALTTQAQVAIENARLFRQLQTKTEELEVASRHKSEFLANMSHELRTPLNAIIGYAELLQEECEDLGQEDFLPDLGKIHSAGKHLLTLISGILDLSKVEAGRMTMFLEDFDIATLIRDADAIVRPLVEKNRNRFMIDCPEDIGTMHADLVKVRQVLFNLLSNSAKFTDSGEITLTVRAHPSSATITFSIRDTGIGMTEEQLGRMFEAFSQANAETSRKYGGTGLGLALSREFCRMMGGDITVTSEAGNGSTFTVTLPRKCIDAEAAA